MKHLLFFDWSLQVMEAATFGDKLFTGTLIFLTILAILVLFAVRNFGHGLLLLKHETYEHSGNYNWLYKTRPFVIFIWNRSEWKNKVKLLKKCLPILSDPGALEASWPYKILSDIRNKENKLFVSDWDPKVTHIWIQTNLGLIIIWINLKEAGPPHNVRFGPKRS